MDRVTRSSGPGDGETGKRQSKMRDFFAATKDTGGVILDAVDNALAESGRPLFL